MARDINTAAEASLVLLRELKCDYAEVRLTSSTSTHISLSGTEVDQCSSGRFVGGSARVLVNGSWGFVSFNNIEDLKARIDQARDCAALVVPAEKSMVVRAGKRRQSYSTTAVRPVGEVGLDEKFGLLKSYNDILRGAEAVQTTRAVYSDVQARYLFLNSEGSELSYDRSYCGIALSSIARDGAVIQPFGQSISGYGGFEIVRGREPLAESVVKTAVDLLKAEPVSGGTYAVVTDQKLAGVFIHEAFGHLSEADFIHENQSMKDIMVFGREFGPPELNVVDDGGLEGHAGYIPFDDEGTPPHKTYLIKNGRLSGRLHSRETAARMNEEPTGNGRAIGVMRQPIVRMTNTYIEEGPYSRQQIMDAVDNGIYAVDFMGGMTNLEMFTFSAACGYEIKNGKPGRMLRDIVLSGNVFTTLKNISMIGNDRKMFGGLGGCGKGGQGPLPVTLGGPHILIKDVLIGGKQ